MFRLLTCIFALATFSATAQQRAKCAHGQLLQAVRTSDPSFSVVKGASQLRSASSQSGELVIPVIFHIVLKGEQIKELGGDKGIGKRVLSQLEVMNNDLSAQNDLSLVPSGFTDLIGNANIRFALAQQDINGLSTKGFQVQQTRKLGFYFHGIEGSGIAFSDAKYYKSDGDQAWDPTSYLNIWVVNMIDDLGGSLLGLTIPPSFVGGNTGIPISEQGIVVNYKAFGVREDGDSAYIDGATGGRTLTHELGHYFGLWHIWGDDEGLCIDNGGEDDGISDTPPQASPSYGCLEYPYYDDCSFDGPGIMFMNFMDYSSDDCVAMFTTEQVAEMRSHLQPGGSLYSLTQHPWLLEKPKVSTSNFMSIWPNPAKETINIYFDHTPTSMEGIHIVDILGRTVGIVTDYRSRGYYSFSTSSLTAGTYFVRAVYEGKVQCLPVVVNK